MSFEQNRKGENESAGSVQTTTPNSETDASKSDDHKLETVRRNEKEKEIESGEEKGKKSEIRKESEREKETARVRKRAKFRGGESEPESEKESGEESRKTRKRKRANHSELEMDNPTKRRRRSEVVHANNSGLEEKDTEVNSATRPNSETERAYVGGDLGETSSNTGTRELNEYDKKTLPLINEIISLTEVPTPPLAASMDHDGWRANKMPQNGSQARERTGAKREREEREGNEPPRILQAARLM